MGTNDINEARGQTGLSPQAVARRLGRSLPELEPPERGQSALRPIDAVDIACDLLGLAEAYHIPLAWLRDGIGMRISPAGPAAPLQVSPDRQEDEVRLLLPLTVSAQGLADLFAGIVSILDCPFLSEEAVDFMDTVLVRPAFELLKVYRETAEPQALARLKEALRGIETETRRALDEEKEGEGDKE